MRKSSLLITSTFENDKFNTYLDLFTGSYSANNLSICDPETYMEYGWKVHKDLCGSDNFPIILEVYKLSRKIDFLTTKLTKQTGDSLKPCANRKLLKNLNIIDQKNTSPELSPQ